MEVCAHLADNEAWPCVRTSVLGKSLFEKDEELTEYSLVSETSVDFLGTDLVCNRSKTFSLSEILDMGNELDCPFSDNLDPDRLSFRKETVYGRIYMDEFISGEKRCLI